MTKDQKVEPVPLGDLIVVVMGDRVWGKGKDLPDALNKVRDANGGKRPKAYIAFICHPSTWVDEMGSMQWQADYVMFRPKEILRHNVK